jgi:hypothetical protein
MSATLYAFAAMFLFVAVGVIVYVIRGVQELRDRELDRREAAARSTPAPNPHPPSQ